MKRTRHWPALLRGGMLLALAAAVLLCFSTSLERLRTDRDQEGKRQLEDSLRRAAVACYAVEGIYPMDVAYLEEHYGVQVDEERYTVYYEIFAENLMPDITVLENET